MAKSNQQLDCDWESSNTLSIQASLQKAAQTLALLLSPTYDQSALKLDAEILLAKALKKPRSYLYTWPEQLLTMLEQEYFNELITQRCQGMPVAYLTGSQEFWSMSFKVNSQVLIPRAATETLVQTALDIKA